MVNSPKIGESARASNAIAVDRPWSQSGSRVCQFGFHRMQTPSFWSVAYAMEHFKWIFRKNTYNVNEAFYKCASRQSAWGSDAFQDVVHAQYALLYNLDDLTSIWFIGLTKFIPFGMKRNERAPIYRTPWQVLYIQSEGTGELSNINVESVLPINADKGMPLFWMNS